MSGYDELEHRIMYIERFMCELLMLVINNNITAQYHLIVWPV